MKKKKNLQKEKILDFVPKSYSPKNKDYNCAISDEINVKVYNTLIDSDFETNQVYLNLGYDNDERYDSSFFFNAEDALELGNELISSAISAINNHSIYIQSENFKNNLIQLIKLKQVKYLLIRFDRLFTDNPEDSMFGTMVLYIEYKLKDDTMIEAIVLSDNMRNKNENWVDILVDELKNRYKVEIVDIDSTNWKFLWKSMEIKFNNWVKKNKSNRDYKEPVSQYQSMLPNNLRDSVKDIADRVMEKIKEEQDKQ